MIEPSNIFKEDHDNLHFEQNGYILVDLLTQTQVDELLGLYNKDKYESPYPFHSTLHHPSPDYRKNIFSRVVECVQDNIEKIFQNPHIFTASFVVKQPHENSQVICHQDWNLTLEEEAPGLNCWISLHSTNDENGALHILPQSHKLPPSYRGTNFPNPLPFLNVVDIKGMEVIYTRPGQAVIYDVRMIHASPPNHSSTERVSCTVGVIPAETPLMHYRYDQNAGRIKAYKIEDDFFVHYQPTDSFFNSLPVYKEISAHKNILFPFLESSVRVLLRQEPPAKSSTLNWFRRLLKS